MGKMVNADDVSNLDPYTVTGMGDMALVIIQLMFLFVGNISINIRRCLISSLIEPIDVAVFVFKII